jgi:hypothetical protein
MLPDSFCAATIVHLEFRMARILCYCYGIDILPNTA